MQNKEKGINDIVVKPLNLSGDFEIIDRAMEINEKLVACIQFMPTGIQFTASKEVLSKQDIQGMKSLRLVVNQSNNHVPVGNIRYVVSAENVSAK